MKNKEMIEELQKYDGEATVCMFDGVIYHDDITTIQTTPAHLPRKRICIAYLQCVDIIRRDWRIA
jgi:hypothetical protein